MMRVYAISDLHGYLPHIPECELLIMAGDYARTRNIEQQRRFYEGEFTDYLNQIPAKYIVAIAGNHDLALEKDRQLADALPWIYLQDSAIELEGVKIYGTPYVPKFYDWAFMEEEGALVTRFEKIPFGLDILITHGPAYRFLDKNNMGTHCGSFSLLSRIKEVMPDSVVHGHIHEGRGIASLGATRLYNVAYVDSDNTPKYNAVNIPLKAE